MHRLDVKLSKVEESDVVKNWALLRLQETKYEIEWYIDEKGNEISRQVNKKVDNNFTIPGLVGEYERFAHFPQFMKSNTAEVKARLDELTENQITMGATFEEKNDFLLHQIKQHVEDLTKEHTESKTNFQAEMKTIESEIHDKIESTYLVALILL